eukprot:gene8315-biopygen9155
MQPHNAAFEPVPPPPPSQEKSALVSDPEGKAKELHPVSGDTSFWCRAAPAATLSPHHGGPITNTPPPPQGIPGGE